jgi:hypothetical protein
VAKNKNKRRKQKERKWAQRAAKRSPRDATSPAMTALVNAGPKLREYIDGAIKELLELGRTHNPLELICQVAANLQIGGLGDKPSDETGHSQVEHLTNLFLSQPWPPQSLRCDGR